MGADIVTALRRIGPSRVLQECLLSQLFRDAKAFEWSEASDALRPVFVFRSSRHLPLS